MAMSWGWNPICQIGGGRYRISTGNEGAASTSVVIGSSQLGAVQSQLPSNTSVSVVLPTNQQGTLSTQLSLHPLGTHVTSSFSTQSSQVSGNQPLPPGERAVRRSPRLAQSTRVSVRTDAESQLSRARNQWNAPRPPDGGLWNSNRNLSNNSVQSNKNYSIYNFEGHVSPVTNTSVSSVSVVYNHSRHINVTHSRLHPAPISLTLKSPGNVVTKPTTKKVKIKDLAFFKIVSTLIQEEIYYESTGPLQQIFKFSINDEEVKEIKDRKRKHPYLVQLRFCKLDGSCEQNDYYPVTHNIAVNSQQVFLPGLETMPRGPMRPVDITHLCQLNSRCINFLMVRCWESCKVFVRVVEKFTSQDLLDRLEKRSLIQEEDTTNEIKKKLQVDQSEEGIASTTLQCSLMCPLSRTRMKLPCRASTCNHLQCFDAATYLQLNECKPKWSCPVCYQSALFDDLRIDGYFKRIIDEHTTTDKIELHPDGNWTPVEPVKKKPQPETECTTEKNDTEVSKSVDLAEKSLVILDSDDDDDDDKIVTDNGSSAEKKNPDSAVPAVQHHHSDLSEVETIVLSDDDSPVEDIPIVSSDTFTSSTSGSVPSVNNANTVDLESEQLAYLLSSRVNSLFGNFQPFEHSNTNLCIPFSRTSTHFNQNALTITPLTNDNVSDSNMYTNFGVSGETHGSRSQRVSKSKNKKSRKLNDSAMTSHSQKKSERKKRRRIVSESASESSHSSDSSKKNKARANKKLSNAQKRRNVRRISDSSESEKSSESSSNLPSVNLISSSDSGESSSNESSEREDSDSSSDRSFESGKGESDMVFRSHVKKKGGANAPEASSRVLRSQAKKRKKKSLC